MTPNNLKKYPRTYHLPFSPGRSSDDKVAHSLEHLEGFDVVVTEKMDGENTTLYQNYIHARSLDSRHHPSRDWVKQLQGSIGWQIPKGWRLCGENMYAVHSIEYHQLDSYFYLFSIWDDDNQCLSWDDTCEWAQLLNLSTPQTLWSGVWDETAIRHLALQLDTERVEGFVVRRSSAFHFDEFSSCVLKWVRKNHVSTGTHWMYREVHPNQLKKNVEP